MKSGILRQLGFLVCWMSGCGIASAPAAHGEEVETRMFPKHKTEVQRLRFGLGPDLTQLSHSSGRKLQVYAIGGGLTYGLSPRWGAGVNIRQGYTPTSGLSATFSALELKVQFSVTGAQISNQESVELGDHPVLVSSDRRSGGLGVEAGVSQYLLNSTTGTIPYTGGGLGVGYEFPLSRDIGLVLKTRIDQLSSGKNTLSTIQFGSGVLLWL